MPPVIPTAIPPRRLIAILALLTAFGPLATDTYLPALPDMRGDLGGSASGVAASLSVFFFGMAAGQLIYGPISDRFGRKIPLMIGTAVFTLAAFAACFARGIEAFVALRLVQSLGGACGLTLARAVVRDLYDADELAKAFAALTLIGMIAPLVAPTLGVGIIMLGGWRAIFAVMTGMGIITMAAIAFGLPETLPVDRRHAEITIGSVIGNFVRIITRRRFTLLAMMAGSAAGTLFSFITGSAEAFMTGFAYTKPQYTFVFTAITVAMMAGGEANRRLVRHFSSPELLRFALSANVVSGLALVGAAVFGPGWSVALALGAAVLMLGLILPNSATLAIGSLRRDAGSGSSLLGVIQFGLGFVASSGVAWFQNGTALPMAIGVAGCAVMGRLCLAVLPHEERPA